MIEFFRRNIALKRIVLRARLQVLANRQNVTSRIYQIIQQNEKLPEGKKIRMVGFSDNIDEKERNAQAFRDAVAACEKAGIMVWFCAEYGAASFAPLSDKNQFNSLTPDHWWRTGYPADLVFVPTAGRTTAATTGNANYIYWGSGGLS